MNYFSFPAKVAPNLQATNQQLFNSLQLLSCTKSPENPYQKIYILDTQSYILCFSEYVICRNVYMYK